MKPKTRQCKGPNEINAASEKKVPKTGKENRSKSRSPLYNLNFNRARWGSHRKSPGAGGRETKHYQGKASLKRQT